MGTTVESRNAGRRARTDGEKKMKDETRRLEGLIAAASTPFDRGGNLKPELVPEMVSFLESSGVSGLYICGTTGEGPSLTSSERRALTEAFVEAAAGGLPVIVQVGHNSLRESRELAAHAQQAGADMISANAPSYFSPDSIQALICSMSEIASAAPDLPFFYYHIPSMTGLSLDINEFLETAAKRIPTFAGIKFSDSSVFDYQAALNIAAGELQILWGRDEMLLSALAVGAEGAVGSTFNVAAPLYLKIIESFENGDLTSARQYQYLSVRLVGILKRHGNFFASLKAVMRMLGLDCGEVRLPMLSLSDKAGDLIRADLEEEGLIDWLSKKN